MFCPGIPGAGKTTITAIVIQSLCKKYQNEKAIGIGWMYLNFRRQEEQTTLRVLTSLLKQIAQTC